ncbi:hypothetical protein NP233_g9722 [Leucocoprinus birnbaumii]|uniref:GPI-anchor transamidase n=1 Tax=Leucocoprinus birnbaumii TaxID=56174 RepID=A0AAD5VM79_9AGAR|nr:hypothetical protein NP233_g9722 [Leucocoprinus birnbaumii]
MHLVAFLYVLGFLSSVWAFNTAAVNNFFERNAAPGASKHTNNWAVLVCASRYWFNYRHMANALGMYRTVKRLGIPDSNIILMLADDASCNLRNKFPGSIYANPGRHLDLYGDNIEVDYRGYEVTVENFIRVLTGRMDPSVPRSKRLLSDERSNVFVYMTGHGGNEFLKFQDNEEISAFDIADAFEQMYQKKRYNEIFFMIDTCQANSMYSKFYSPNILATGSSEVGENSYSYANDNDIGVAVIDAFTHYILEYMEGINKTSQMSMQDLFNTYDRRGLMHVVVEFFHRRNDLRLSNSAEKSVMSALLSGRLNRSLRTPGWELVLSGMQARKRGLCIACTFASCRYISHQYPACETPVASKVTVALEARASFLPTALR